MNIDGVQKKWMATGYTRLSKDDGDKEESDSINNQKALIQRYAENHPELHLTGHYSDDGYTGVNFNRPGFQEMMEEIRNGEINCIIVKDLSRFGRNYIETGRYIERIFPTLGIRFIAVNDNYDSLYNNSSSDQLLLPFKNLINDAYSRDISVKVRSNLDVKRRQGDYVGPSVPFGYRRSETDRNKLVTDRPAANIVRLIFAKKIEGLSNLQIAAFLNERKVPTPIRYKQENGGHANSAFQVYSMPRWYGTTVRRILENEVYTGTLLQGKTYRPNYKIRKPVARPQKDWFRKENAHEAVISRRDFDLVQDILDTDTHQSAGQETIYPFSGLVVCGSCRQNCSRKQTVKKSKSYFYYGCYLSGHTACCKGFCINESRLEQTVTTTLRQYINCLSDREQFLSHPENAPGRQPEAAALTQETRRAEAALQKYRHFLASLYEDYHDGLLNRSEYLDLRDTYQEQADELTESLADMARQQETLNTAPAANSSLIDKFRKYMDSPVPSRRLLVSMVKKIYIYPKNRIHIVFRFPDEFESGIS